MAFRDFHSTFLFLDSQSQDVHKFYAEMKINRHFEDPELSNFKHSGVIVNRQSLLFSLAFLSHSNLLHAQLLRRASSRKFSFFCTRCPAILHGTSLCFVLAYSSWLYFSTLPYDFNFIGFIYHPSPTPTNFQT